MVCLKYFAKLDKNLFPIPSSMQGYLKDPCKCDLTYLNPEGYFIGTDEDDNVIVQAYHPKRLRYWFRTNCDGEVLPNSLFISKKNPGGNVIEYKKTYIVL